MESSPHLYYIERVLELFPGSIECEDIDYLDDEAIRPKLITVFALKFLPQLILITPWFKTQVELNEFLGIHFTRYEAIAHSFKNEWDGKFPEFYSFFWGS